MKPTAGSRPSIITGGYTPLVGEAPPTTLDALYHQRLQKSQRFSNRYVYEDRNHKALLAAANERAPRALESMPRMALPKELTQEHQNSRQ